TERPILAAVDREVADERCIRHLIGELPLEIAERPDRDGRADTELRRQPSTAECEREQEQEAGEREEAFHAAIVAPRQRKLTERNGGRTSSRPPRRRYFAGATLRALRPRTRPPV